MLDAAIAHNIRSKLHSALDVILDMRETQTEAKLIGTLPGSAADLFRGCLGDEAFDALVKCEDQDRLVQLLVLLRIGGVISGRAFDQSADSVWQSDAAMIERDLLTLYGRSPKDGPPTWLCPRGSERSSPDEREHQRRAVIWQRFIAEAREGQKAGMREVADAFEVTTRTISDWVAKLSGEPGMQERLDAATGFLHEETGERLAMIQNGAVIKIVWMKQRHDSHGRGKSGHYQELLFAHANEYRMLKNKKIIETISKR